ncbi:MAG: single-stranded-DNA-specific exonuclease RecJ [Flavobacteriales bacterium]
MQKRWLIKTPENITTVEEFRSKLKVDRIVAELLLQRGISTFEEAEDFFRPKLEKLHDPFLMKDLKEAAERLNKALIGKEKVLLFGDYDVDGTTAVALLYSFLREKEGNVDFYIPDRYAEGYGISRKGIDHAIDQGFKLIISLDCGIRSVEHVAYAAEKGVDFIVCDHHNPGDELPECLVLDPKRSDCSYPFKELSGCGVGFKLLEGLCQLNGWGKDELFGYLDLLAVSIGADIVQVTGENRILCYHGMKLLNENPRIAFKELIDVAGRSFPLTLTDVVFTIAPRINAAGRLRSGRYSVELMISNDADEIRRLAIEIDTDNKDRRKLDQLITSEALEILESDPLAHERRSTVVFKSDWHKGVVGIVASRLIEKHFKPTIVLTESNGKATGSARTVNDFDIHSALVKCEHLLEQFGGHTHAAGMTLALENVEAFIEEFERVVNESIAVADRTPEQAVDLELNFNEIFTPGENRMKVPRLKRILEQFEPHGPGNMKPVFLSTNVFSTDMRILKEDHLKISIVQPPCDLVLEGIGFNLAEKSNAVASGIPFDIVYTLESNKWKDREIVQLNLKDLRES